MIERGVSMMLDTTQSCTQNNTSKCAYQIRERCGLNLGTIWIKSGSCVSCSRYHVGCTQVPCGLHPGTMWAAPRYHVGCTQVPCGLHPGTTWSLYGLHLGTLWVQSVPHMGTHYFPIWDPYGAHLQRLYGAKLGKLI